MTLLLDDRMAERARRRNTSPQVAPGSAISELAWTLVEYRWTAIAVFLLGVGIAVLRLALATPTYEESVLVQVEGHTKTVPGFAEVSPLFDPESPAEAEMRIMRSRPLLESVVTDLRLDVEARPLTMPVVGDALARRHKGPGLAPAPFGLGRWAWGGERIAVPRLHVSADLLGEPLTLTALDGGRFEVTAGELGVVAKGQVGKPTAASKGPAGAELLVTELIARPGTRFELRARSFADVVETLQASLRVAEQGKATGVVELSLEGPDAARTAEVLNGIAKAYVRQNVERTSAAATKTLEFLESQLPALRATMDRAEGALNAFRSSNGTMDLSVEGGALLSRMTEMDKKISDAQVDAAELRQRYTDDFPALIAAEQRLRNLRAQRAALDDRMKSMPGLELESVRLMRSARLATDLYLTVQNRAQDLRIVNAGWIGSVRVLEPAVPPIRPSSPKSGATLAIGLLLGIGAGIGAALARKGSEKGVQDPDEIEAGTGLPVLGAIPRSSAQRALERRRPQEALSFAAPNDAAVENLRSLRTSVQFALARAKNNVVTVTGPAPRVGKSFVSVNLAHLLAGVGKRVVLVDGDLRRGGLQRHFGVERHPGLSDVLLGTATLDEAVRATGTPGLSFLPTGRLPSNPAELGACPRMQEILDGLTQRHDIVIVDTPPVLSVTDSALVGRHAGVNLLVLRAREQSIGEIAFTLRRLDQHGVSICGAILNDVRPSRGRYGRYGGYRLYST